MAWDESVVLQLAGLYHDPPWKPWVVLRSRDKGAAPGVEDIASGVLEAGYLEMLKGLAENVSRAHERHALLVPLAVAQELSRRELEDLARLFEEAAKAIARDDKRLGEADRLASAIDRHTLYDELSRRGLERGVYTRSLRLVNPFTLERLSLPSSIGRERIQGFLRLYAGTVAEALERLCEDKSDASRCGPLAVTVAYLLLEPSWYYATSGADGGVYAPPADTRVPTHTVFDHANSVMAVLHLLDDGCLAVVDLAGVQAWISESRRLRDLWAASWLASYLAWRAVEPLVRRYGPGVLVSPPGRLNPFLASRLLGAWLGNVEEDWVWKALGLSPRKRWPVDPVMPTRLLLAVPGEACGGLEEMVRRALEKAWREILEATLGRLREACRHAECGEREEKPVLEELFDLAMRVEPPLAVRVLALPYSEFAGDSELILYQRMLVRLADLEAAKISAPGRRTGQGYLEYARKAYETIRRSDKLCTVCGKGMALVNGENIDARARRGLLREIGRERLCPYCLVKRLLRYSLTADKDFSRKLVGLELGGVSWRSVWHHSTRARFLGDRSPVTRQHWFERVKEELRNLYSRRLLKPEIIANVALEAYGALPLTGGEAPKWLVEALGGKGGDKGYRLEVAAELWPLILEALDNPERLKEAAKNLGSDTDEGKLAFELADLIDYMRRYLGSVPRRYAIVQADGDYMGSGLLSGKIPGARVGGEGIEPAGPGDYFREGRALARVQDDDISDKIIQAYKRLAERVKQELGSIARKCEQDSGDPVKRAAGTLPVTPAYHMSVSRSLALVSALDRESVERLGGDVVYLGGDDALVIVAPEDWGSGGSRWFPALRVAEELRRNWRGLPSTRKTLGLVTGFLALEHEGRILHLAPAPGAYGRSSVVLLGDARYPMWLSLAAARSLEEAKDGSRTLRGGLEAWRKDILLVASDTRGAAVLPLSDTALDASSGVQEGWWPVEAVRRVLHMVHDPPRGASKPAASSRMLYSPPETVARLVRASLDSSSPDRLVAAARLVTSELSQRAGKTDVARLIGDDRMMPASAASLCGSRPESLLDPGLCILIAMARNSMLPAKAPPTRVEREEVAWRIASELFRVEVEVALEKLRVEGVDYAANGYMRDMTVRTDEGVVVRLPLPLGVLAAAYVYTSATSPRLS